MFYIQSWVTPFLIFITIDQKFNKSTKISVFVCLVYLTKTNYVNFVNFLKMGGLGK